MFWTQAKITLFLRNFLAIWPFFARETCCDCDLQLRHCYWSQKLRERNSGENFRGHGRKTRRKFGKMVRRFSSFNFQEKWAQDISQKFLDKFQEPRNKILSPRDSGSWGAQVLGQASAWNRFWKDFLATTEMRSWTRIRRNGGFGARAQAFSKIRHCRNKAFWYVSKPVWIHLRYVSIRTCVVFGSGSRTIPRLRGIPPYDYSDVHGGMVFPCIWARMIYFRSLGSLFRCANFLVSSVRAHTKGIVQPHAS